jgi:hypothetical protein
MQTLAQHRRRAAAPAAAAARLDGVDEAGVVAGGVHLVARDGRRLLPRLLEAAEGAGAEVTSVELVEPDLEAVFLTSPARRCGTSPCCGPPSWSPARTCASGCATARPW